METKNMNIFPIYRKLSNNKSFYKINSNEQFEEIQVIGSKQKYFIHEANQYPEKLKIMDMIQLDTNYLESNLTEWIDLTEKKES